MSQTKNNSTIIEGETGLGFGSGIAFGVVMGLVGYFMVSSGKGKKLLSYVNELARQPNLDAPLEKFVSQQQVPQAEDTAKVSQPNEEVAAVKNMLAQLTSRFQTLSTKQKKPPYTNS